MSSCSTCPSAKNKAETGKPSAGMAIQDEIISSTLGRIRYKLFIMSGKGGVGKSSVTVNTAAALAARGYKVASWTWTSTGPACPTCWACARA